MLEGNVIKDKDKIGEKIKDYMQRVVLPLPSHQCICLGGSLYIYHVAFSYKY